MTDLSAWLADGAPRSDDRTGDRAGHLLPMADSVAADAWGGHKAPAEGLWGGVANHLDLAAFTAHVAAMAWIEPRNLQILLKDEADPWFRLYMLRGGQLSQHAPTPDPDETDLAWSGPVSVAGELKPSPFPCPESGLGVHQRYIVPPCWGKASHAGACTSRHPARGRWF